MPELLENVSSVPCKEMLISCALFKSDSPNILYKLLTKFIAHFTITRYLPTIQSTATLADQKPQSRVDSEPNYHGIEQQREEKRKQSKYIEIRKT